MGLSEMDRIELLEINRTLKRRLYLEALGEGKKRGMHDSLGNVVETAEFCGVDILRVFDPNWDGKNRPEMQLFLHREAFDCRRYMTQLHAKFEHRGIKQISPDEARLILGYDGLKAAEDVDVVAMLEAAEHGMRNSNAYYLGPNIVQHEEVQVPVAYFRIPRRPSLVVNLKDSRFSDIFQKL